jgi:hypothetical protein
VERSSVKERLGSILHWIPVAGAVVLSACLFVPWLRASLSGSPDAGKPGSAVLLMPWQSIGGCGAGGSGGLGGGNIKWVGRGVSGGILDVQSIASVEISQARRNLAFMHRFAVKPTYSSLLALSVPVLSKTARFQPQTNLPSRTEVTGGIGDLILDFSQTFGSIGQYSFMATLMFPTGQYDIKRGEETGEQYLSNILQLGGGVYAASIGLNYTRDFDKGILIADFLATHPFVLNVSGKSSYNDEAAGGWGYDTDLMSDEEKKRFEYYFKPYGENDLGGYTAPSLYGAVYYGDKRSSHYVHSYACTFTIPLQVNWIPNYSASVYDPIPDPDFWTWSGTLQYGVEFSNKDHPLYLVVAKQIHDRATPPGQNNRYSVKTVNTWNGPDWRDFASTWSFAVGIRTSAF